VASTSFWNQPCQRVVINVWTGHVRETSGSYQLWYSATQLGCNFLWAVKTSCLIYLLTYFFFGQRFISTTWINLFYRVIFSCWLCVTLSSTQPGHDPTFVKTSQVAARPAIIQFPRITYCKSVCVYSYVFFCVPVYYVQIIPPIFSCLWFTYSSIFKC
jgi:hypothetical protein